MKVEYEKLINKLIYMFFVQLIQIVERLRKQSSNPLSPLISKSRPLLELSSPLFLCLYNERMIPYKVKAI